MSHVVADAMRESMKRASWIRKMFEEGARLQAEHGPENVFDFSLGNPILELPTATGAASWIPSSARERIERVDTVLR